MSARLPRPICRLAAIAALLAMCLRLMLPLLHGGHDCDHGAPSCGAAVQACSCGVPHGDDAGQEADGGEHEDDGGEPCGGCLACQLEDQSPGGDPLQVLVVIARPHAPPMVPVQRRAIDVLATCVRPPPRAPPIETV